MTSYETIDGVLTEAAKNCNDIDEFLGRFKFGSNGDLGKGLAPSRLDPSKPLEYLRNSTLARSWHASFNHALDHLDEDFFFGPSYFDIATELRLPVRNLTLQLQWLESDSQSLPNMPPQVLQNVRLMEADAVDFFNGAIEEHEYMESPEEGKKSLERAPSWKKIRLRRSTGETPSSLHHGQPTRTAANNADQKTGNDVPTHPVMNSRIRRALDILTSNSAARALTIVISFFALALQTRASFPSTQPSSRSGGIIDDPDFQSAVQSFLMQIVALYTALAPACRTSGPRYKTLAWLLSALSLVSVLVSLAIYPISKAWSSLLACIATILQSYVTLELVYTVNDIRRRDVKSSKKDV